MKLIFVVLLFVIPLFVLIGGCVKAQITPNNTGATPAVAEQCRDECTPAGSVQCYSNSHQSCGNYDEDSCLEWGNVTTCTDNTTCSKGVCIKEVKKPDLGKKIDILHSGDPKEEIDVLFIPQRINDTKSVEELIEKTILYGERGLFSKQPFTDYEDKFNVFYVDKNIDEGYFNCVLQQPDPNSSPMWNLANGCDNEKMKQEYKVFNPDFIVVLFDLPDGYHSTGGEVQYLQSDDISPTGFNYAGQVFVHEFGHQFGGLADQYVTTSSPAAHCGYSEYNSCFANYEKGLKIYPNLDTLGCPKWCESYNISKLVEENKICANFTSEKECSAYSQSVSCTWFKTPHPFLNTNCVITQGFENIGLNCKEDTKCIFGGDYGQLAFNLGFDIMGGGEKFSAVSKEHLKTILDCCYPRNGSDFCRAFRSKFENPPEQANHYFKIAYSKIAACS